ncbi:transglutaminase family protein [Fictibacillus enclensis]|uniref:transglutaminase family protein n=1 Tax=Fictibacillus enclensis TaxID=1017270 RepID=UPI0032213AFB
MKLIPECVNLTEYLKELEVVDYSHPLIQEKVDELNVKELSDIEKVKVAFEFVRDKVSHSWDIHVKELPVKPQWF